MVLPTLLDGAPCGRIASRQRARPPGCVHRTLACGSALANTRVLPAEGSTSAHYLVKGPTASYFGVHQFYALGRISPDPVCSCRVPAAGEKRRSGDPHVA